MRSVRARRSDASYGVNLQRGTPLRLLPHPDRPETESWRRWALRETRPRALDLFAGCGGLSLGLEQAGYRVILSVDSDPWSIETHRHNFPGAALDIDLSDRERLDRLIGLLSGIPLDLIAGGPPCQPFSRAGRSKIRSLVKEGKRQADDERRDLWRAFLSVIEELRPRAVLMENVPDMALGDELRTLRVMIARLEAAGYEVETALADAWRFGVPQHRQRLILVALRDAAFFQWPAEQKRITLSDAIGDLPRLREGFGRPEMTYARARTPFQREARAQMPEPVVWDHVTRAVREDDREAFRLMTPGTRYGELPKRLRRYRADIFDDKYNRLSWNDLSRSITAHIAKDGYWYIHPGEARTLTVREAARIQTFPDHFRFAGTRSHAFSQIGNAVPPAMGKAIAAAILKATRGRAPAETDRPSHWTKILRERLLAWAGEDAAQAPWRHCADPWMVLAGVVLDSRPPSNLEVVRSFIAAFPKPQRVKAELVRAIARFQPEQVRKRIRRLVTAARALTNRRTGWQSSRWPRAAGVGPAEEAFVRAVGLQEDMVLVSTPALRVISRLKGEAGYQDKPLSEGKMALGRIIGTGADVPRLNAALAAFGTVMCRAQDPLCGQCPLSELCVSVRSLAAM